MAQQPIRRQMPTPPDGALRECELVPVQRSNEHANTYELADGSILGFRTVVTEVWRIVDQYDAEGNPLYLARSGNFMTVTGGPDVRRRAQ